jgi:hypothetical protein
MTLTRTARLCCLCGLMLFSVAAGFRADAAGNPYRFICERNVFGLRPVPPPVALIRPSPPLPKVILTGITTILGDKRALLKVQFPPQPPKPAKEQCFILAEGQSEGPIKVLEVNEKTSRVKVENSGTVVDITFEKPPPRPTAAAMATAPRVRPYSPRFPLRQPIRKF